MKDSTTLVQVHTAYGPLTLYKPTGQMMVDIGTILGDTIYNTRMLILGNEEVEYLKHDINSYIQITSEQNEELEEYMTAYMLLRGALFHILRGANTQGPFTGMSWLEVAHICKDTLKRTSLI